MLRAKYRGLQPTFTERSRRLWAATEARALGHGSIAAVADATGISRSTIQRGLRGLATGARGELGPEDRLVRINRYPESFRRPRHIGD